MHSVRNAAEANVDSCCHALLERMCYGLNVVFDGVETETPKVSRELGYREEVFPSPYSPPRPTRGLGECSKLS